MRKRIQIYAQFQPGQNLRVSLSSLLLQLHPFVCLVSAMLETAQPLAQQLGLLSPCDSAEPKMSSLRTHAVGPRRIPHGAHARQFLLLREAKSASAAPAHVPLGLLARSSGRRWASACSSLAPRSQCLLPAATMVMRGLGDPASQTCVLRLVGLHNGTHTSRRRR